MSSHRTSSSPMSTEPAVTVGTISGAVAAVLALAVAFGLDLTETQTAAILAVVAAVGPIIGSIVTRGRVSPVVKPTPGKHPVDPNVRA